MNTLNNQGSLLLFKQSIIDRWLLGFTFLLACCGIAVLYSVSSHNLRVVNSQVIHFLLGFTVMIVFAQIKPEYFYRWAPWLYLVGILLLLMVPVLGETTNGAKRWLHIAFLRFQPSEIMKLVLPMMIARFYNDKPLPPSNMTNFIAVCIASTPILLTATQPDLGTAVMLSAAAGTIIFLSGLKWRTIAKVSIAGLCSVPVLWHFMARYQKDRVLTLLYPSRDPLGKGYHIIQSKIALGSGGIAGKGWLNSTQSHLQFLPEHTTDFIFSVIGEEFGLLGGVVLISIFLAITFRGFQICCQAQDAFARLLAGGLTVMFFLSAFVNMGMVMGLLPVVGIPLPLISYGGTSMITLMASLGIIMSIHNHRKLLSH